MHSYTEQGCLNAKPIDSIAIYTDATKMESAMGVCFCDSLHISNSSLTTTRRIEWYSL